MFGLSWSSRASCLGAPWRPNTKYFCLASNFRHQKLEAEQKHLPWTFLKTRIPKLGAFKNAKISSNQFPQCNFLLLFNLLSLISLFYKALLKQGIHLHRYFLFLIFHILFSNYASYFFSHLIISYKFLHLWKVLSWLDKGFWKGILRRYFHFSQFFMPFMFYIKKLLFKLILSPLVCKCRALTRSQPSVDMNVHESQFVLKTTFTQVLAIQCSLERIFTSCSSLVYSCELFPM